jgi:hypothetical protein
VTAIHWNGNDPCGGHVAVALTAIAQLRIKLPLWTAVRWYVEYAGEARINDVILRFLGYYGSDGEQPLPHGRGREFVKTQIGESNTAKDSI